MRTSSAHVLWTSLRPYSLHTINKAMQLISSERTVKIEKSPKFKVTYPELNHNKPLVIIMAWLLAQQKHILKFAELYMDQGFDVLNVSIAPWQLLWPAKGSQVVAGDLVDFLHVNEVYQPLLVHGFSIGGYQWGEALVKMNQDKEIYKPILDRIVGQIWDSAADITEIPIGFPKALFPKNPVLQAATEKYIRYHMRTFYDVATVHYIRSSQMFHTSIVRAPALFFFSKSDPVGCVESNMRVKEAWDAQGISTRVKCWDKSPHVLHFKMHPKEYMAELFAFLDRLNLVEHPEKVKAKL
ncbi:transmembrane protein 53-B isoform X2 [Anabrus simplex]